MYSLIILYDIVLNDFMRGEEYVKKEKLKEQIKGTGMWLGQENEIGGG